MKASKQPSEETKKKKKKKMANGKRKYWSNPVYKYTIRHLNLTIVVRFGCFVILTSSSLCWRIRLWMIMLRNHAINIPTNTLDRLCLTVRRPRWMKMREMLSFDVCLWWIFAGFHPIDGANVNTLRTTTVIGGNEEKFIFFFSHSLLFVVRLDRSSHIKHTWPRPCAIVPH